MGAIMLQEVTKVFAGGVRAVDQVSMEIPDGQFTVLVGPSGCGKSTLLRMIAGLEEVSDGDVRIGANVVNDVPPARRDVAMVFQNYALYPHMTIRQNISFPLRQQHLPKEEIEERVRNA